MLWSTYFVHLVGDKRQRPGHRLGDKRQHPHTLVDGDSQPGIGKGCVLWSTYFVLIQDKRQCLGDKRKRPVTHSEEPHGQVDGDSQPGIGRGVCVVVNLFCSLS